MVSDWVVIVYLGMEGRLLHTHLASSACGNGESCSTRTSATSSMPFACEQNMTSY